MSDSGNNECPLCGKDTQDGEIFCRDCQEIAQNSYPSGLLSADEEAVISAELDEEAHQGEVNNLDNALDKDETSPSTETEDKNTFFRKNKKLLIFFFAGLIIFMIVGVIGGYLRQQNLNTLATETAYWNKCIEENTPLGYSKYLVKYPEGKYSEEAYQKIVELRDNERKAWEKLRSSNDIDALFAFLKDHPETPYLKDIRHVIDSLSWIAAQAQNSADVYLAYLENSKLGRIDGEYIALAQERYDYLSQLKTLEGKDLDEVKKTLTDFFSAMSTVSSKGMQKLSVDTLSQFYTSKNLLSKHIADSLTVGRKADKIRSVLYTPVTDSIEAILDNKGVCFITLPVKKEVTYSDRKKKKDLSQSTLSIELNNKKLQAIYKKSKAVK